MKMTMVKILFVGAFILCFAVPVSFAEGLGMQASTRISPLSINEGLIGLKIAPGSFAFTPRVGFGFSDQDKSDNIFIFTVGSGFDYYFSEEKLRPYVGGDIYIDYVNAYDSDIAFTLNPHLGAEYWLTDKFSIGGNIGFQFGFGEILGSDMRFGTTTMMHATYYF
jgi:hypothetical protein